MKCEIVTGNMPQLWEDLLSQLHEKEYPSESIRHYREAMGRVDRYMRENQILEYTEAVGETYLATHGGRISSGRQFYMSFYVRRLNDILNKRPYVVVHTRKKQKDLKHFILHLMRGQVFDFGGLTWFTMGGAASHDIQDGILDPADPDFEHRYWLMRRMRSMFRVKGVSWWAEEMPSQAEYQEALANLERVNWTVDCVLTHCAPSGVVQKINPSYGTDELTDFLEMVSQRCKFAYWFFGHYHENRIIDQKYILQWEKISELGF